MKSIEV